MEKMVKIVYNACFGGFGLSEEAIKMYEAHSGKIIRNYYDIERDDPILVDVVEFLGSEKASRFSANLQIALVPKGAKYRIDEYDGSENVMTIDEYDWKIA